MQYKPSVLPQINAPYKYIIDALSEQGIECGLEDVKTTLIQPSQGVIISNKMNNTLDEEKAPIWLSKDYKVIDGHHRYGNSLIHGGKTIKSFVIGLPFMDAVRVLNKIQDIFDYENQRTDEVVAQDQINAMNDPMNMKEFLRELYSEENLIGGKKKKVSGYRKEKIKENSKAGNFFMVKPVDGYIEYNMEFDNILDCDDLGMTFNSGVNPVVKLASYWFPNIDLDKVSKKYEITKDALCNRLVAMNAKKMKYDGIKYGDVLIQGF